MEYIVGVDPGINGAWCLLDQKGNLHRSMVFPLLTGIKAIDWSALQDDLRIPKQLDPVFYIEEQVIFSGKQNKDGTYISRSNISEETKMKNYGILLGVLKLTGCKVVEAKIASWQTVRTPLIKSALTKTQLNSKEKSALAAIRLWGVEACERVLSRKDTLHDGMVDAALIARYGYQTYIKSM